MKTNDDARELSDEEAEERDALGRSANDWFMLGVNAYVHDALGEALESLNHAVDLAPENGKYFTNRADIYADMGYYEEALSDYAVAIFLGDPHAEHARADYIEELKSKGLSDEDAKNILRIGSINPPVKND